jgi:hypothetical protein
MGKTREIWWFDQMFAFRHVDGPFTVTGVITGSGGPLLVSTKGTETCYIPEEEAYLTKNEALLAHYEFNEKRIIEKHTELVKNMGELKKYYLEGLNE